MSSRQEVRRTYKVRRTCLSPPRGLPVAHTSGRFAPLASPASVATHAVSSVSGKNWSYSYDPNGNMTTRSENGAAYTQEFNAENKVERVVTLEDADFSDQFDTKDTNAWAYNSYQTVPFNLSGHGNVVKNVGTGSDYAANFRRKSYNLTSGESVQFEFRVTESNPNATFAVETSGSWDVDYNRWGLRAWNDKITVHYRTGGVTTQSVTLIDDLETGTWYVATLVVDDGNGFYLRIHKKDDPSIQGSYHFAGMPVGKSWRFRHWIKYGTSYVDNYSEQSASQTAFVYDGDGNRVKRQEGGVTTYYVGGTYEKQGSTVTKYYYFGGQRVAMRKGSTLTYLHGDHLGSTSLATHGTSGAKVSRVLYFPYGETRHQEGTLPTDFKYTGQREEDGLGGLYDYNARYYDPYINRWISPDTIIPDPANPQSLNRYAYVVNNPVKYVDSTGHDFGGPPPLGPRTEYEVSDWPWWMQTAYGTICLVAPNCSIEMETQHAEGVYPGVAAAGTTVTSRRIVWNDPDQWAQYQLTASVPTPEWVYLPVNPLTDSADDLFQQFGVKPGRNLNLDAPSAPNGRSYITYVFKDGDEIVYVGRASGPGTPIQVMQQRIVKGHDHFLPGYTYEIVDVQASKFASQGAEEFFIQGYKQLGANLQNACEAVSYGADRAARTLEKLEAFFIDLFSR